MLETLLALALSGETRLQPLEVSGRDIAPQAPQATATLDGGQIAAIRPTHPAEVLARLPGTWITRGSGQEHLSAVRSPLLSGAGGCGALLILEAGIPVRPPGFCNVNNLFEVNLDQAASISVLRGPGGLGHAAGGLHGVIDVRPRPPGGEAVNRVGLQVGSDDYDRVRLSLTGEAGSGVAALDASATRAGSFRRGERHDHRFVTLQHAVPTARGQWRTLLTGAYLDQETAGFILGRNAYEAPELRRANLNPGAFRRASALRVVSRGEWTDAAGNENRLTGFARRSRMTFLQHFLPGQPLERNGQISVGMQFDRRQPAGAGSIRWGVDIEFFRGFLEQVQDGPAEDVPPPVAAVRPPGRHYDYRVDGRRAGGYVALERPLGEHWRVRAGVHGDRLGYDYDNRMASGNRADDGSECGFGGCLYTRPADRRDDFLELAPELTLSRELAGGMAWLRLARGFRAPQATELYRLQSGQRVADLDAETLDAVELGVRGSRGLDWELVGFYQRKRDFIFRDAEGFNVSDGRSDHRGVEFRLARELTPTLDVAARGTYAVHRYRFDRDTGGERIVAGNDMPSAPRVIASAELVWRPHDRLEAQLAVEYTGGYWLNAENTRRYDGHTLVHAFVRRRFGDGWSLSLRLRNLAGRRYAERADFAFGDYRYFPGPGRSVFAALEFDW